MFALRVTEYFNVIEHILPSLFSGADKFYALSFQSPPKRFGKYHCSTLRNLSEEPRAQFRISSDQIAALPFAVQRKIENPPARRSLTRLFCRCRTF